MQLEDDTDIGHRRGDARSLEGDDALGPVGQGDHDARIAMGPMGQGDRQGNQAEDQLGIEQPQ